ncbi:ABC transporter permease [Natrialbaceae archaeon GCM10025810]|uniref:ABC transporter permease n=1 Tax=Halovalidus salilacus TaxID=3075124 RepID=UPI0036092D8B
MSRADDATAALGGGRTGASGSGIAARARAVVGLAVAQLRRSPGRTALTVLAVALAVLSVTLLASLGVGVIETGERGMADAGQDIWISSDPIDPASSGPENPIADAHGVSADIAERDDVSAAYPLSMHDVYVGTESTDPSEMERVPGVGVHRTHDGYDYEEGTGFETDEEAAAESPSEPTTKEIVLDPATAEELGVSVGDTVVVGTSRQTAPETEFTVVGTSSHHSQYTGSQAATVPLTDLRALSGTSGTDRASFITVSVEDGEDPEAVSDDLSEEYPEYDVRTSDEQVDSLLGERPLVVASGLTLVGLAVVGGLVLTVNLLALVAYQQRDELAALRAIGLPRWLLAGTIGVQGLVIGLLGGLVALGATPFLTAGLNRLAASTVGFEHLLRTPLEVYVAGFVLAVVVGTIVALAVGWRAARYATLEHLEA